MGQRAEPNASGMTCCRQRAISIDTQRFALWHRAVSPLTPEDVFRRGQSSDLRPG